MPYEIWRSLSAKQKLQELAENHPEIVQQIWQKFNLLATEREDFITGMPSRTEIVIIGQWKVYYRVWHRLKSIDIIDIIELPNK